MYDYKENVCDDIMNVIDDYGLENYKGNRDGFEELLNEELWTCDSVTGNASGSYTFNTWKAEEYVTENTELLNDACFEFGVSREEVGEHFLNGDWEYFDVTVRCYLLAECIGEVLDIMEQNGVFDEDEDEEEA